MDKVAPIVLDVVLSPESPPEVLNVVHPRPTSWDVILRGLREELGGNLPLVPLTEWVAKLETYSANPTKNDLEAIVRSPVPLTSC